MYQHFRFLNFQSYGHFSMTMSYREMRNKLYTCYSYILKLAFNFVCLMVSSALFIINFATLVPQGIAASFFLTGCLNTKLRRKKCENKTLFLQKYFIFQIKMEDRIHKIIIIQSLHITTVLGFMSC